MKEFAEKYVFHIVAVFRRGCAAYSAHHVRRSLRRPLVVAPIYMASANHCLHLLYSILRAIRLKTPAFTPSKSYRRHSSVGTSEIGRPCVLRGLRGEGAPEYDAVWARRNYGAGPDVIRPNIAIRPVISLSGGAILRRWVAGARVLAAWRGGGRVSAAKRAFWRMGGVQR